MTIEWNLEKRALKDLIFYPKNPRSISKHQFENLKKNIEKFGLIDKPFINTDNLIIGGHQRVRLLKSMGYYETDVYVPNRLLSEKEVEELNIRHNQNSGSFDDDILANQFDIEELCEWGFLPSYFGMDEDPGEKKKKAKKPQIILKFDNAELLYSVLPEIEKYSITGNAELKIKI